ncbi:MAG: hypothetical protein M0C28_11305 [Candidatus Moduliflexus flocculans]|nr:hypothetical protein [Candidatus Moduliflexus flocculans]
MGRGAQLGSLAGGLRPAGGRLEPHRRDAVAAGGRRRAGLRRAPVDVDLTAELRAEGLGTSLTRGFVDEPGSRGATCGATGRTGPAWMARAARAAASASPPAFHVREDVDLRAAVALDLRRLLPPVDPFGQREPEQYAATEAWEVARRQASASCHRRGAGAGGALRDRGAAARGRGADGGGGRSRGGRALATGLRPGAGTLLRRPAGPSTSTWAC